MDFSGILSGWDIVLKLMGVELAIGCVIGLIVKQIVKIKAQNEPNTQVFSSNEYTSIYFGRNFPRCTMDIFLLPPEFIIVKSEGDAITSEDFYNFLGGHVKYRSENGKLYSDWSFSLEPVYLCTVFIPSLVGFFPSLIPFISQYFSPLLFSGLAWMFATFTIQSVVGTLKNAVNPR